MPWTVRFHPRLDAELPALPAPVREELLARALVLREFGPNLGRPNVDTLKGSSFANMKELRFQLDGVWRFAFAFDPLREAIILVGGDKQGLNERLFYRDLVKIADERYAAHIATLSQSGRNRRR
jgi:hypothetical protein